MNREMMMRPPLPTPPTPAPEARRHRRRAHLAGATVLLALLACTPSKNAGAASASQRVAIPPECEVVAKEVPLPDAAPEASAVAAGRRYPNAFWTLNDNGNPAELIAFDLDGKKLGVQKVEGAKNEDWEDLAIGPCPAGSCLYIADTGDNDAKRKQISIWRVPEPDPSTERTAPAERFEAVYPGGPRDTEAIFVLPNGEVYLVSKGSTSTVALYRWPTPLRADSAPAQLELLRTLASKAEQTGDRVTGAAATQDGRWVAIRTYAELFIWPRAALLGNGLPPAPIDLAPAEEAQGEGVAIGNNGNVVLTSEGRGKKIPPAMTRLRCPLR